MTTLSPDGCPEGAPALLALMPPSHPTSQSSQLHRDADTQVDLDWRVVEVVATRLAGNGSVEPFRAMSTLVEDFDSATSYAELLVSDLTGLHPKTGPAKVRVISRTGWIRANIAIFRHYLTPVTERLSSSPPSISTTSPATTPLYLSLVYDMLRTALGAVRGAARIVVSAQIGVVLGFLAKRVLGQYDLVLPEEGKDSVYYVGPNIVSTERHFGFDQKEFRLWIALHETAHRAQFTGVDWLKDYFTNLVDQLMSESYMDPQAFATALRRMAEAILRGKDPFGDTGLAGIFANDAQRERIRRLQALMCILEGHGNFVMDSIGDRIIPSSRRMSEILRERRASNGLHRVVFRLLGMDTKLKQYELGEEFVSAVVERAGSETFRLVWQDPSNLPTLEEIEEPERWLARVCG